MDNTRIQNCDSYMKTNKLKTKLRGLSRRAKYAD
jgi:hypothetical protein